MSKIGIAKSILVDLLKYKIETQMSENQCVKCQKKHRKKEVCEVSTENMLSPKEPQPLHTSMELLQVASKENSNRTPIANRKSAGSNWETQLQAISGNEINETGDGPPDVDEVNEENSIATVSKAARLRQKRKAAQHNKYVAMDCEMVGVGFNGQEDMLARVSIVNKRGEVLVDKFVKPREAVTDYRTSVSGIRPHDIENGEEFKGVQDEVVQLLQGKILVGHAIRNDLSVLHIKHPFVNIRDTARYKPLCRLVANGRTPSLKRLTQAILGQEIQTGEHNSVEDARAAMSIYNRLSSDWEKYLKKHQPRKL